MDSQKINTGIQLIGALLGLPVAAAGAYTAYQAIMSPVSCPALRAELVAALDKPMAADPKRQLMRKGVSEFERNCASYDADSLAVFKSALAIEAAAAAPAAAAPTAAVAAPSPAAAKAVVEPTKPVAVVAWVPLESRVPDHIGEKIFEELGQANGQPMLRALRTTPLLTEPIVGAIDQSKVVGRIDKGQCVMQMETKLTSNQRPWARIEVTRCAPVAQSAR